MESSQTCRLVREEYLRHRVHRHQLLIRSSSSCFTAIYPDDRVHMHQLLIRSSSSCFIAIYPHDRVHMHQLLIRSSSSCFIAIYPHDRVHMQQLLIRSSSSCFTAIYNHDLHLIHRNHAAIITASTNRWLQTRTDFKIGQTLNYTQHIRYY